ncbi:hypothetical protein GOODEAATRI_000681 [Goodea atripinnis]|uniref:stearoyl-CoA 9-desaturase n=1 Tax=Goodea atripinnis TaxID=208336 RepID=A0ABV0MXM9_9TELE
MGSRPPGSPQILRDRRRPTQRQQGLLLRSRRLAAGAQTSRQVSCREKSVFVNLLFPHPLCLFIRHYKLSVLLMCFFVPMFVPWYFWGESLWVSYFIPALLRYALVLNASWLVNSAAHMWGNRPYDKNINPRENRFVTFSAIGEGFHNYHHTFPYDYATSEYGCKLNLTTCFIDFMCFLGLAKDRKRVSREVVLSRLQRTGDGSHRSG